MKHRLNPEHVARIGDSGHAALWLDAEAIFLEVVTHIPNDSPRSKLSEFKHRVQNYAAYMYQVKVVGSKGDWCSWWNELVDKFIDER